MSLSQDLIDWIRAGRPLTEWHIDQFTKQVMRALATEEALAAEKARAEAAEREHHYASIQADDLEKQLEQLQAAHAAAVDALKRIAESGPMILPSYPPKDFGQYTAQETLNRLQALERGEGK